ncbi:MAG TPA: hypothetical protein VGX69_05920 [Solirubrobacteraceae bacterium]|jgi:hypothetical protein|nr:hypothetical protein [Solirubrobacteraceae bacterium]
MEESVRLSDDDRLRQVVLVGMEIVGAAGGGGVGLIGGPAGAIGGAAAGVAMTRVLHRIGLEVYDRLLVHRQQARVGAALVYAAKDAGELSAAGAAIRNDGFFDEDVEKRSDAEELMEGVLLHAADAYQELKLRHLAAIVPALAARPDVPAADGHWITDLAGRLTWRQLIVLAIFRDPPEQVLMHRDIDQDVQGRQPLPGVLADEVEELATLGLIGTTSSDGETVRVDRTMGGLEGGVWQTGMATWRLTVVGQLLADLTRLDDVPKAQRERVLDDLLS